MRPIKLIFIISLLFAATSCEEETRQPEEQIVGAWEWVKSIDPRFSEIITPVTEGINETWIFMDDDTVEIYINGIIQNQYHYFFEPMNKVIPDVPETEKRMMLIINDNPSFYSIEHNTLIIDHSYVDGWKNYYKREN